MGKWLRNNLVDTFKSVLRDFLKATVIPAYSTMIFSNVTETQLYYFPKNNHTLSSPIHVVADFGSRM